MNGHMSMRSGNPALTAETFTSFPALAGDEAMTISGTVNKTGLSLIILLVAASYVWNLGPEDPSLWIFTLAGIIGGLLVAMATIFKQTLAPFTTPLYAGLEGLALGGISVVFEAEVSGDREPGRLSHLRDARSASGRIPVRPDSGHRELQARCRGGHRGDRGRLCSQFRPGIFGISIPLIHSSGTLAFSSASSSS